MFAETGLMFDWLVGNVSKIDGLHKRGVEKKKCGIETLKEIIITKWRLMLNKKRKLNFVCEDEHTPPN